MKPTIYAITLIALIMTAMWSAAAVKMSGPSAVRYAPVKLTQAMYDAIRPGMTIDEVVAIVGCEATDKLTANSPTTTSTATVLRWHDGKHVITCRSQDGTIQDKHAKLD